MNKGSTKRVILGTLSILLAASAAFAASDIPLRNWSVPSAGELGKADHFTGRSAIFAPFQPCRLEDSRVSLGGAGPIGSGVSGGTRDYDFVPGAVTPACASNLPGQVVALSLNFTVVGTLGPGFLYVFPEGGTPPPVSVLNYNAGETKSNAAIVPVNAVNGAITVGTGVSGTDVIIDINGVFYNNLANNDQLSIFSTLAGGAAILGQNNSTAAGSHGIGGFATAGVVHGVQGQAGTTSLSGASGVHGINDSGASSSWGVFGQITDLTAGSSSTAVRGQNASTTGNGIGVWGSQAGSGYGVLGETTGSTGGGSRGVWGRSSSNSDNAIGVQGSAFAATGIIRGMYGESNSGSPCAAGIFGEDQSGAPGVHPGDCDWGFTFGIIGTADSTNVGVLGLSQGGGGGVRGCRVNTAGICQTHGVLGFTGTSGVHSFDDITAVGAKPFVVPYEGDPSKQIVFIATEGDEATTFTRGRIRLDRGLATIRVPDHFLRVTELAGWSVQLTPIGDMATLAVLRMDPAKGEILIKGSRSVEVFYRIEGVRKGYADFHPVQTNEYFVPANARAPMENYNKRIKDILIKNGIYNPDGSPNLETAERMGWKQKWDQAEAAAVKARAAKREAAKHDLQGQKE